MHSFSKNASLNNCASTGPDKAERTCRYSVEKSEVRREEKKKKRFCVKVVGKENVNSAAQVVLSAPCESIGLKKTKGKTTRPRSVSEVPLRTPIENSIVLRGF